MILGSLNYSANVLRERAEVEKKKEAARKKTAERAERVERAESRYTTPSRAQGTQTEAGSYEESLG